MLSLAEIDRGFKELEYYEVFLAKKALLQSFNATKNLIPSDCQLESDYITKAEFRLFLEVLYKYIIYWIGFNKLDENTDERISREEFIGSFDKIKDQLGLKRTA